MRKHLKVGISLAVTTLGLSIAAPLLAQTSRDFTATAVQSIPDQPDQIGLIAKSSANMRFEFEQDGNTLIKIIRPTEGIVLMLDPQAETYLEFVGPAADPATIDGPISPCPEITPETQGLICERSGSDVKVSGVQTERWLLGSPQQQPQVILWDPARHKALRHETPDGSVMQMTFKAMEDMSGRQVEHWTIDITMPGQAPLTGGWWFDPSLRVVLREDLPGGGTRRLDNVKAGPVDPALFTVPDGWQKQEQPVSPPAPNE